MRLFKVYTEDESDNLVAVAQNERESANVAFGVWDEANYPQAAVRVVELLLPNGHRGHVYEPHASKAVFGHPLR